MPLRSFSLGSSRAGSGAAVALLAFVLATFACDANRRPGTDRRERLRPSASERRFAVVVGNNRGGGARSPLRHAEHDADRVARVLSELGHFSARDVVLQKAGAVAALRDRLADLARTIAAQKLATPNSRALLVFYFSGHSDGVALELGDDRLPYADLRSLLQATGADIRVGLIDTCKSGAAIGIKGGVPGRGFDLETISLPALAGEVFLTASRSDEVALEVNDLAASIFSLHVVSGLRGAADADVDGLVTLDELYRHTAVQTSGAAAETLYGAQTPVYEYRLVGEGNLVLSHLGAGSRHLYLPAGFDRILVSDQASGRLEAEVRLGSTVHLVLPAGEYRLRGLRAGRWSETSRKLDQPATTVAAADLSAPSHDAARDGSSTNAADDAVNAANAALAATTAGDLARSRLGGMMPLPLPRSSPFFCEGTVGSWKGCRGSGCTVCVEMVRRYENYFRNHPNCLANSDCKGRYFSCSSNCPPPTIADSCEPLRDGWQGCSHGCGVCSNVLAAYPRYFENRPNCIPTPGRCKTQPGPCGAACPPPQQSDR